jgi:hypothetical protein
MPVEQERRSVKSMYDREGTVQSIQRLLLSASRDDRGRVSVIAPARSDKALVLHAALAPANATLNRSLPTDR